MSEAARIAFAAIMAAALATPARPETAEPAPSPDAIVASADRVRNPDSSFHVKYDLVEYVGGAERERIALVVYAKPDVQAGRYRNLVRYSAPPRDLGKAVLYNGSNLWFYDPASRASVRISPQQRLIGQAADGDVLTANLSRDYAAKLVGAETVDDADRKKTDCWHVDLAAKDDEAMYLRIEAWIERGSYRPVKSKFYSDSGRLLKIAFYNAYKSVLGAARPTQAIIIDAVDTRLVTTVSSSDYQQSDIPDWWFQREALPRLPSR